MKKFIMLAGILAVLSLPAMALAVPVQSEGDHGSFSISDLLEGNPAVNLTGLNATNTTITSTSIGNEQYVLTGSLTGSIAVGDIPDFLHPGTRAVILASTNDITANNPTGASDVIYLTAGAIVPTSVGSTIATQSFTFQFASDEATNFSSLLTSATALPPQPNGANSVTTLIETGAFQNVALDWPNGLDAEDAFLAVNVQSDVEVVPLPPSVLLLGTGLLGLMGLRRVRKS